MLKFESPDEVLKACTPEKQLVIWKNKVYDATKFIPLHPGGKKILEREIGKRIDEPFEAEGHSDKAKSYFG